MVAFALEFSVVWFINANTQGVPELRVSHSTLLQSKKIPDFKEHSNGIPNKQKIPVSVAVFCSINVFINCTQRVFRNL